MPTSTPPSLLRVTSSSIFKSFIREVHEAISPSRFFASFAE
jgi:hypothetical protein